MLVVLVDDRAARTRAVPRVPDQRLESRSGRLNAQILRADVDPIRLEEVGGALRHQPRRAEHFPGLLLRSRPRIDLGPGLVICREHVETDPCGLHALRVLSRDLLVHTAEPPEAVTPTHPAEHIREDEALPWLELDPSAAPGPHALRVGKERNESTDALALPRVEFVGVLRILRAPEVIEVALAGELDVSAREHPAGDDILRILVAGSDVRILRDHQRSAKAFRGRSGAVGASMRVRAAGVRPNSTRYRRIWVSAVLAIPTSGRCVTYPVSVS